MYAEGEEEISLLSRFFDHRIARALPSRIHIHLLNVECLVLGVNQRAQKDLKLRKEAQNLHYTLSNPRYPFATICHDLISP